MSIKFGIFHSNRLIIGIKRWWDLMFKHLCQGLDVTVDQANVAQPMVLENSLKIKIITHQNH